MALLEQDLLDAAQLATVRHERQRDRQLPIGEGQQEGLQLAPQHGLLVQEDADSDAAEVRVGLALRVQVTQPQPGVGGEQPHRQRPRQGLLGDGAVVFDERLARGLLLVEQEEQLRAVEPDAGQPDGRRALDLGQVAGDRRDLDLDTVRGLDRKLDAIVADGLGLALAQGGDRVFGQRVLAACKLARIHAHLPLGRVEDQEVALRHLVEEPLDARHRGDAHGAREDRRVAGQATTFGHDPEDVLVVQVEHVDDRQLTGHQDVALRLLGLDQRLAASQLDVAKDANADVAQVHRALPQGLALDELEDAIEVADDFGDGGIEPHLVADDQLLDVGDEDRVLEVGEVRIQDARIARRHLPVEASFQISDLIDRGLEGAAKAVELTIDLVAGDARLFDRGQIVILDVGRAQHEAWRDGDPEQELSGQRRPLGLFGRLEGGEGRIGLFGGLTRFTHRGAFGGRCRAHGRRHVSAFASWKSAQESSTSTPIARMIASVVPNWCSDARLMGVIWRRPCSTTC